MRVREIVPTTCTLLAMLSGFLSLLVTIEGIQRGNSEMYALSAKLIMLAMILDGLDGNLARWFKAESEFGAELDTYVDLTAFGIAPAILIFAVTLQSKEPMWRVLLPSCVALSGVVRLARFKVKDPLRGQGGYAGLPITANAGWVAMFVYLSQSVPGMSLQKGWGAILFLAGIFIFIVLQITNIRYPKPTKKVGIFLLCFVLVAMLFWPSRLLAVRVAATLLTLGVGYIFIGPLFVKGVEVHRARRESKQNGTKGSHGDE